MASCSLSTEDWIRRAFGFRMSWHQPWMVRSGCGRLGSLTILCTSIRESERIMICDPDFELSV